MYDANFSKDGYINNNANFLDFMAKGKSRKNSTIIEKEKPIVNSFSTTTATIQNIPSASLSNKNIEKLNSFTVPKKNKEMSMSQYFDEL